MTTEGKLPEVGGGIGGGTGLVLGQGNFLTNQSNPHSTAKVPWIYRIEEHSNWPVLARVPEKLTALIPLQNFTVRQLLLLERGQLIESAISQSDLIPVNVGAVQIAWGEFEVVDDNLAIRITRLA
jgi:flagellar motor switch protein FliN/FliY